MSRLAWLLIILVVVGLGAGGYWWYIKRPAKETVAPSVELNPTPTPTATDESNQQVIGCEADFRQRFSMTPNDLMAYVNNQPEAATVLVGFRNFSGKIIATSSSNNLPLNFDLNSTGKITKIDCSQYRTGENYTKDVDFTIPEADFARLISNKDNLQENQISGYFQNFTTKPATAKQIIFERILSL